MRSGLDEKKAPSKFWLFAMELGKTCGCHQKPTRSFFVGRYQFPFCARCTGVIGGEILALALFFFSFRPWWSLVLVAPLIVDGSLQYFNVLPSTNVRRFLTGLLGGAGFALFVLKVLHWFFMA